MMRALQLAANAVDMMMTLYGPPATGRVTIDVEQFSGDGTAFAHIDLPCTVAVGP